MPDNGDNTRSRSWSPYIRSIFRPTPQGQPPEDADPSPAGWSDITPALLRELRLTHLSRRRAWEWGLVLTARKVPHDFRSVRNSWRLFTPLECAEEAMGELLAYERENVASPHSLPDAQMRENTALTIGILLLLGLFHGISRNQWQLFGFDAARAPIPWESSGIADCMRMTVLGEWWRSATALTLHADAAHVFGNMAAGALFMVPLCRELGSGAGWLLTLLAAMAGNLLSCRLQGPGHLSLGASTAVFAAVGVLSAMRALRGYLESRNSGEKGLFDRHGPLVPALLPLGAGLALLGLLGASDEARTDVVAHLCGFACGWVTGAGTGLAMHAAKWRKPLPPRLSQALGVAAVCIITGAWYRALL